MGRDCEGTFYINFLNLHRKVPELSAFVTTPRCLSSVRFKSNPGYRPCDPVINSSALIGGKFIIQKKSFTRFALQ